jgi:ATP-dependent DNA ligase
VLVPDRWRGGRGRCPGRRLVQPIAGQARDGRAFLWAFDLLTLDGEDLRSLPLDRRKSVLKILLTRAPFGLALNDYAAGDGPALFAQACAMGLEGIVSKRRSSRYRSGRSPHWLKAKNPQSRQCAARRSRTGEGRPGGERRLVLFRPSLALCPELHD